MKPQLLKFLALLTICAGLSVALGGCVWSVGGKEHVTSAQPTRGQELIDLKKARDQGAITQEEYDAKRKQILER